MAAIARTAEQGGAIMFTLTSSMGDIPCCPNVTVPMDDTGLAEVARLERLRSDER